MTAFEPKDNTKVPLIRKISHSFEETSIQASPPVASVAPILVDLDVYEYRSIQIYFDWILDLPESLMPHRQNVSTFGNQISEVKEFCLQRSQDWEGRPTFVSTMTTLGSSKLRGVLVCNLSGSGVPNLDPDKTVEKAAFSQNTTRCFWPKIGPPDKKWIWQGGVFPTRECW